MVQDGSVAWDAKDYLIQQERCEEVTIEQVRFPSTNFSYNLLKIRLVLLENLSWNKLFEA